MLTQIKGLHHVTSMAADARQNNDFFTQKLGLRRVKKTVNFDAPDVYHLYYADEFGTPGSVMTYFPFPHIGKGGHGLFLRELAAVMPRFANVRRMGSAALDIAYVAAGRLDGYWERGLNTWDFAAGSVLIREAGGTFGTLDGKPVTGAKDVICGNEACEQALRAALKTAAA